MNASSPTAVVVGQLFSAVSLEASPSEVHAEQESRRKHPWKVLLPVLVLCLLPVRNFTYAQSPLPPDTAEDELGTAPYASYHGGDIDSISLANGTVALHLPILSYPQRGNLTLSFDLMYNNMPQHWNQVCAPVSGCEWDWDVPLYPKPLPTPSELGHVYVGWGQQVRAYGLTVPFKSVLYYYIPANWFIVTADGSTHILGNLGSASYSYLYGEYAQTQTGDFESLDATGWRMSGAQTSSGPETTPAEVGVGSNTVVIDPNGTRYTWSGTGSTTKDSNGNQITSTTTSVTDSVGRSIPFPPTSASADDSELHSKCPPAENGLLQVQKAVSWTPPSYNGGNAQYVFCYVDVEPNMSGDSFYGQYEVYNKVHVGTTLQSIVLPNGTNWTFAYNDPDSSLTYNNIPFTYGTLSQVTLPTGGTISYTYTNVSGRATVCQNAGRWVQTRTVNANDGTGDHTWTYTYAFPNVTVTDPLGNDVVHTFTAFGLCGYYETETDYYQGTKGSQQPLKKVVTTYNRDASSKNVYPKGAVNVVPIQIVTTWADGSNSQVTKSYDVESSHYLDYLGQNNDPWIYGKVAIEKDYDYSGTTPLRIINTTYQWQTNPSAYGGTYNFVNLVSQVQVTDGSGTQTALTNYGYDGTAAQYSGISTQHGSPYGQRGNQTSVARWRNLPSAKTLTKTKQYFDTGEVYTSTDELGNTTTFTYDPYYAGSLLTKVQYPTTGAAQHIESYAYDLNTGLKTIFTDENSKVTSYNYDEMDRRLSASYPDGGSTTYSYNDLPLTPPSVTVTEAISSSQSKVQTAIVDGLGRLVRTELTSDPEGWDYVDTTYGADGRKASVSNPYRTTNDPTYGVTQYQYYDALGRLLKQVQPDGSSIQYLYTGHQTVITDEASTSRKTETDGLGRLTKVWEDPSGLNYETDYGYDSLSNLISVSQQGTNRSFSYDSVSRLQSATNPESGPVSYTYDDTDFLTSKTDGRGITITYTPDALHRLVQKSYSDGEQTIYYCYDNQQTACGASSASNGIGRRTGMKDASGSTNWSYDVMGRTSASQQALIGNATTYTYNLDGSLSSMMYPDATIITYQYSNAGRPLLANYDNLGYSFNYVKAAKYTAQGALASYQNDSGATVTNSYNNRLQPLTLLTTTSQGTIFNLTYNFNLQNGDNGNVARITNNLSSARSQTFTYDSLNRLYTAGTSSTWGDSYGYDRWGNLLSKTVTRGSGETLSASIYPPNSNQLNGYGYDGAGNMTSVGGVQYNTFNAENQWVSQSSFHVSYLYDGDGRKVKDSGGASGTRIYAYDAAGQVVEETDQNGAVLNEYLYFGGSRMARVQALGPVYYYYADHLGTSRLITDSTGTVCYDADYFPWGGEQNVYVNTCSQNYKFTGKERDPDMGVDYFGARFYHYTMARFYSPDWSAKAEPVPYANLEYPQTLNLYSYAGNNPLSRTDPDGHCTNGGKQQGFWWCLFHDSDQDAERARQQLAQYKNISINGKTPAEAAKGLNNTQTVRLERSVFDYISSQAMRTPGMMVALALAGEGAEGLEASTTAAIAEGRATAWIVKTGKSALASDITTNITAEEFGANLEASGYTKSLAKDGVTSLYSKGNEVYSIYPKASSTGGPTANLNVGGQIVTKIRLQQ